MKSPDFSQRYRPSSLGNRRRRSTMVIYFLQPMKSIKRTGFVPGAGKELCAACPDLFLRQITFCPIESEGEETLPRLILNRKKEGPERRLATFLHRLRFQYRQWLSSVLTKEFFLGDGVAPGDLTVLRRKEMALQLGRVSQSYPSTRSKKLERMGRVVRVRRYLND